ncbi:hypothetical protein QTP88_019102 [Uroleucon formosanum]
MRVLTASAFQTDRTDYDMTKIEIMNYLSILSLQYHTYHVSFYWYYVFYLFLFPVEKCHQKKKYVPSSKSVPDQVAAIDQKKKRCQ